MDAQTARVGIGGGDGVIEVHVRDLNQLFNSMDPSPFFERDLDVDAEEFIVSWARELPDDKPLAVLVHLDQPEVASDRVRTVQDSLHAYFDHRAEMTQRRLRDLFRIGRTSLTIGVAFLALSILVGDWVVTLMPNENLAEIIRESLLIGGWVAMWRPLEIFLYDWWPIRNERRIYTRLGQATVRVACTGKAITANT
jgi:hypothetical protein